jgi:hypothetical protein
MRVVRALHRYKYDKTRQRFTSDSFKNNQGSISVIDAQCVAATGVELCSHIEQYYDAVIDRCPFAYWVINTENLLAELGGKFPFRIDAEPNVKGDECHRNIVGIPDKPAQKWAKQNCKPPNVFLCLADDCVALSKEAFEGLHTHFDLT